MIRYIFSEAPVSWAPYLQEKDEKQIDHYRAKSLKIQLAKSLKINKKLFRLYKGTVSGDTHER